MMIMITTTTTTIIIIIIIIHLKYRCNRYHFCDLVVRVPDYRSRGPGSIPGATIYPEK
jgi:hypothetical protein